MERKVRLFIEDRKKTLREKKQKLDSIAQLAQELNIRFRENDSAVDNKMEPYELQQTANEQNASQVRENNFKFSPDFRSVSLRGQSFTLTSRQAQVVEILYNAYLQGPPDIGQDYILEKLGSPTSRLRDTFRSRKEAWGVLIIKGNSPGTYRLNI